MQTDSKTFSFVAFLCSGKIHWFSELTKKIRQCFHTEMKIVSEKIKGGKQRGNHFL